MIHDVVIVGTGPSGLMAGAILKTNKKVLIIDSNESPGKKLLISGKGQCNYTNGIDIEKFEKFYGANGRFIKKTLSSFDNKKLMEYFKINGVDSVIREDGKVFPSSMDSKDILRVLIEKIKENGHEVKYNCKLIDFYFEGDSYTLITEKGLIKTRKIVLAAGGKSQAKLGSDGKLLDLLKKKGVKTVEQEPSLTPVYFKDKIKEFSGVTFDDITVTCIRNNKKVGQYVGRLLVTHKGFSGPVIINNSRNFRNGDTIIVNFLSYDRKELENRFIENIRQNGSMKIITLLRKEFSHLLTERFLQFVMEAACISSDKNLSEIKKDVRKKIIDILCNYKIENISKGGFDIAMSTVGGVSLKEISPKNFELKKFKNVFVIGEMIDIDGDTGGFNIQSCFSMGYVVGMAIKSTIE